MRSRTLAACAVLVTLPSVLALYACGSSASNKGGGGGGDGGSGDSGLGGDSHSFLNDGGSSEAAPPPFEDAGFTAPDCPGCTFPGPGAPACPAGTPPINIVYPNDGVLVPPNMNVVSVMWTPFGSTFQEFEVDFTNAVTDMHVVTKCATQTVDTEQPTGVPSGGCELQLSQAMWSFIADQNRGGDPVTITVRGTTDGACATSSAQTVRLAFAAQDVLGVIYYWKSTITANGVGGQVWQKDFGNTNPETDVTSAFGGTCNGCHALSRDGLRMVINSDDDDSDDEYGDVMASLIDMTTKAPLGGGGGRGNMKPGFGTFYPDHTKFLMSHGLGTNNPPTNVILQYDGDTDNALASATEGAAGATPTMPDWSPDGKSIVFVMPKALGSWDGTSRTDDDHVFGGSLYTATYSAGVFGAATPLFVSG
ncbi:MAG: hypothetical protein ACRELB_23700, partial [Polyangiaceae bacterium]